ncbi:MAG TPA: hypothetical protein VGY98_08205 [Verrucomicrobiae bacterium]|nr:hypothetical protein [Verrucomicrobiae bacterium]
MDIKSLKKKLAIALAMAGMLILTALAQAQEPQDIYYMVNFYPPWGNHSSLYPNWNDWPSSPSEVNFQTVFGATLASSGVEITSTVGGYGSGYADLNNGVGVTFDNGDLALATNDSVCLFNFTVNPTPSMASSGTNFYMNYNWIGVQLIFNLDSGIYSPPVPYCGWNNPGNPNYIQWSGSNVTVEINMASFNNFTKYTQGGTNHFYGCNIGIDPAVIFNDPNGSSGKPPYDITFNSIIFAAPPVTPPNPTISAVGPNIVISWPDPNNMFTLYQSANMARFSWSPWTYAPVFNNGTNTVTITPPLNQALFFRLANSTLQ